MSVYKREWKDSQGKAHSCWYFHKTINGVRYRESLPTARNKKQAQEAERAILAQIHHGTFDKPKGDAVFIDFAEKVFLPWAKENKKSTSDKYYIEIFKEFFKRKTFAEISSMLIEKFKSERRKTLTKRGTTRKPASVNRELECLSSIFSMAMRKPHKLISENPCREVAKLPEENERNRYLTADEQEKLLAQCVGKRAHLKNILLVALNTGMRRGEILSLKWNQIDFTRNMIHLVKTKSGKSREVPINSETRKVFEGIRQSSEWVFPGLGTGKELTECKRAFVAACEDAGIVDLHFHDLRHTAATRMAEMGAEPSTIQDILGHSDLRMTALYTHTVESRKRSALERISAFEENVVSIEERKRHDLVTQRSHEKNRRLFISG